MFVVTAELYADEKPYYTTHHIRMEAFENYDDAKAYADATASNIPYGLLCETVYLESLTLDGSRAFCNCFMDEDRITLLRLYNPDWVITNL